MSAPTTAEVRAEIAHEQRLGVGSLNSRCAALKHYALPLAEHRDALAAEVKTLREALEIACDWWGGCEHHPDDCPGVADECKAAKRVNELAAKGAGR